MISGGHQLRRNCRTTPKLRIERAVGGGDNHERGGDLDADGHLVTDRLLFCRFVPPPLPLLAKARSPETSSARPPRNWGG